MYVQMSAWTHVYCWGMFTPSARDVASCMNFVSCERTFKAYSHWPTPNSTPILMNSIDLNSVENRSMWTLRYKSIGIGVGFGSQCEWTITVNFLARMTSMFNNLLARATSFTVCFLEMAVKERFCYALVEGGHKRQVLLCTCTRWP